MKIVVARITSTPTELCFEGNPAWWRRCESSRGGAEAHPLGPVVFRLQAHEMGDDLHLEGSATGTFECVCSRCVARYRHSLRESFRIVLEPAGDRVPTDPEGVASLAADGLCLGDEFELGWYRGAEIDLSRYFQELVALALPLQPLCREDCRGLCPRCGVDRNVEECSCEGVSPNSPFAVLRALRADRGEN